MANENEEKLSDDLKAFEAALGSLQPIARPIDRDRLMYLAGQASASGSAERPAIAIPQATKRRGWGWPLATTVSLLLSISLMGRVAYLSNVLDHLAANRSAGQQEIAMLDPAGLLKQTEERAASSPTENYIALRNAVVNGGADALPVERIVGRDKAAKKSERPWPTLRSEFLGG